MKTILSLGAGVQSTTLLLMSIKGELPPLDCAIFADTGWEPREVYSHLEWLKQMQNVVPIHVVKRGSIREHTMNGFVRGAGGQYATMPLRVLNDDGTGGMIRRQCTREYKIEPIERFIKQEVLGLKKNARWPKEHAVDQWMGISVDEVQRMRESDKEWNRFVYPLANYPDLMLPAPITRQGCIEWLAKNYPRRNIPRSCCIGCPFRGNKEWRYLRDNYPDEWADAIEVDTAIRHADKMGGEVFLHRDCVPLEEANIDKPEGDDLFDMGNECLGYCGS